MNDNKTRNILLVIGAVIILAIILVLALRNNGDDAATMSTDESTVTETTTGSSTTSPSVKKSGTTSSKNGVTTLDGQPNPAPEAPSTTKGLTPVFLQDLVKKGADTIYKYVYQEKTYYMIIDNEVVNVGGKKEVYNSSGINVASCSTNVNESKTNSPLCVSALSKDQLIYQREG